MKNSSPWYLVVALVLFIALSLGVAKVVSPQGNEIPEADALVLAEALEQDMVVHAYFYDPRLPECRRMTARLRQVLSEDGPTLYKISVKEHPTLARRWHVNHTPTLLTFYKGKPINAAVGLLSAAELKEFLSISYPTSP